MFQSENPFWTPAKAFSWLCGCKDCFKGLHWFLDYGTLLGAVRDGDLIPWDFDIDMGAPLTEKGKMEEVAGRLREKGYQANIVLLNEESPNATFIQIAKDGITGHISFNFHKEHKYRGQFMRSFTRRETRKIRGVSFPVPGNPEKWLTHLYGDWRTPRGPGDPLARPLGHRSGAKLKHRIFSGSRRPANGPPGSWHG